jgi:hypothetical protein
LEAVAKRYARDWPGTKVSDELRNRILQGTIEDVTP